MNKKRPFKCVDCPYWWEDDGIMCCHYFRNDGCAPCEVIEREETDERAD